VDKVEPLLQIVKDGDHEKLLNLDEWIAPYQDFTVSLSKEMDKLNDTQKAAAVAVFGEHSYSTASFSNLSAEIVDGIPVDVKNVIVEYIAVMPEGFSKQQLLKMWNRIRLNRVVQQLFQKLMDT
jgi:hypothetical protein